MACDISKGRTNLPCKDSIGGIKNIYIMNGSQYYDGLLVYTNSPLLGNVIYDANQSYITYKFVLKNSGNTYTQDITSNRDAGTTIFTQTLNVVMPKISAELEYQIKLLCYGNPRVFVETNNGEVFVMGLKYGCEVSGKVEVLGTIDSMTGYTLNIVAVEDQPVYYLFEDGFSEFYASISSSTVSV
jgi:hypothetical protein